jgi:hypothetical protein
MKYPRRLIQHLRRLRSGKLLVLALAALCAAVATRQPVLRDLPEERTIATSEAPVRVTKVEEKPEGYLLVGANGPISIHKDVSPKDAVVDQVQIPSSVMPADAGGISAVPDPDNPEQRLLLASRRARHPFDLTIP